MLERKKKTLLISHFQWVERVIYAQTHGFYGQTHAFRPVFPVRPMLLMVKHTIVIFSLVGLIVRAGPRHNRLTDRPRNAISQTDFTAVARPSGSSSGTARAFYPESPGTH